MNGLECIPEGFRIIAQDKSATADAVLGYVPARI
jgi:hypothetical protein